MYDTLIKNGTIVDGTGAKSFRGDVAIKGDRIAFVGPNAGERAKREIDATDLVVTPGFIDVQNHSDSYGALFSHPMLESMFRQGITTVVIGQCGSSLAPLLKGSLASIQKWTNISGINVNWLSVAEFNREFSRRPLGVNIATLVGHATLRRDFVGNESRALTEKEQSQIEKLYERSLREGAWGISVGLEYSHERSADEKEIQRLCEITARHEGVVSFHLRTEGRELASAVNEVLYVTRTTKTRAKIAHFKKRGERDPQNLFDVTSAIEKAKSNSVEIYFDVHPYTVSTVVLYLLLPEWSSEGGKNALMDKLRNPEVRKEIAQEMEKDNFSYDDIIIAMAPFDRTLIGKSVAELAKTLGKKGHEVILDLLLAGEDQVVVFVKNLHEAVVESLLRHPQAMIATDGEGASIEDRRRRGLIHPRSFGTTARVFERYVRERGTLSLEEAVQKLSGLPAKFMGMAERGVLRKGAYADVAILDLESVRERSNFENPYQYPAGIPHVFVNGVEVVKDGNSTNSPAGRVLQKI